MIILREKYQKEFGIVSGTWNFLKKCGRVMLKPKHLWHTTKNVIGGAAIGCALGGPVGAMLGAKLGGAKATVQNWNKDTAEHGDE